jgi:hypothetical protein
MTTAIRDAVCLALIPPPDVRSREYKGDQKAKGKGGKAKVRRQDLESEITAGCGPLREVPIGGGKKA